VAICPNVGWFKDFADPQTSLDATFNGKNILPTGNSNWTQLDDSAINKAMDAGAEVAAPAERAKAWAEIDKMITAQAPAIHYTWDKEPQIRSANVVGVPDKFTTQWSLTFSSLK
jgi:peptide/nickel transport system substrate-binding protein